jgi:hypothetical protein
MKVIKSVAVGALSLATSSAFAVSSNWEQFAENDQAKFYVDASTYQVHKTMKQYRQIWQLMEVKKVGKDRGKFYKTLVQHDCDDNRSRVAAIHVSDARNNTITLINPISPADSPFVSIIPDSIIAGRHQAICAIPE